MKRSIKKDLPIIGWREWVSLPELGLLRIKAKIDTGARTSALHAFSTTVLKEKSTSKVTFEIHPLQYRTDKVITCVAEISDIRWVSDSGGHLERRYVISTPVVLGNDTWPIEITLTNRDTMRFRMLLGRAALWRRFVVNPTRSFLLSKK